MSKIEYVGHPQQRLFEPWEMEVGDLCMFVGNGDVYREMTHRIIYQVVMKVPSLHSSYSRNSYHLAIAFDFDGTGSSCPRQTVTHLGTIGMKKLGVLELGLLRMQFDSFIECWLKATMVSTEADVGYMDHDRQVQA